MAEPYRVFVEDWAVTGLTAQGDAVQLVAHSGAYSITLDLKSAKPAVAQGERGLSAKSDTTGQCLVLLFLHAHGYYGHAEQRRWCIHRERFELDGS